jgi:cytoskeletal protein CcmA (bactofilin family)
MWGKNEEGQATPAPAATPPAATPSAVSARQHGADRATVFGKTMKVVGDVSSDEELYVDGELEGSLELRNRLTIGPTGKIKANIKAQEVVVFGSVRGNVEAEHRISLRAGATIVGDIKTAGIVIEDGAYFKGGIDISRTEPGKQGATPAKPGAVAPQASAAAKG